MELFYPIYAGVFGLLVGSFLNVVIHRLPLDEEYVRTRSRCPQCRKLIRWFDNIPVVSYILLLGRCRRCKARISPRYPLVELLTGALFFLGLRFVQTLEPVAGTWWVAVGFVFVATFLAALVAATFIDFDHTILPDEITKTGMWLSPVASVIFPWIILRQFDGRKIGMTVTNDHVVGLVGSLIGIVVGAGAIWLVAIVGKWVFRKDAMGFGDVKFMGMIGGFIGPIPVLMVFFIGCLFGSVVGITLFVITRSRYLAFGPYLALGAVVMLLYGREAIWVATVWWPKFLHGLFGSM